MDSNQEGKPLDHPLTSLLDYYERGRIEWGDYLDLLSAMDSLFQATHFMASQWVQNTGGKYKPPIMHWEEFFEAYDEAITTAIRLTRRPEGGWSDEVDANLDRFGTQVQETFNVMQQG